MSLRQINELLLAHAYGQVNLRVILSSKCVLTLFVLICKQVQKSIASSPHLLIEGDPCLGKSLVTSKKKLPGANAEKQLQSAKNKYDVQPTLHQQEHAKDNTEANQPSPT